MATLAEVARRHTALSPQGISHLQRLVGEWGLLSDLSFADLILYVPTNDDRWSIVAQVRPATGRTIYTADYVGSFAEGGRELLAKAYSTGDTCEGDINVEGLADPGQAPASPGRQPGRGSRRLA